MQKLIPERNSGWNITGSAGSLYGDTIIIPDLSLEIDKDEFVTLLLVKQPMKPVDIPLAEDVMDAGNVFLRARSPA